MMAYLELVWVYKAMKKVVTIFHQPIGNYFSRSLIIAVNAEKVDILFVVRSLCVCYLWKLYQFSLLKDFALTTAKKYLM